MINIYCEGCWEKQQKEMKALKEERASAICDDCGRELKEGDHVFCLKCQERKAGQYR